MTATQEQLPLFIAGKKVIIAGGGISGLAFAISLLKQFQSLPPTITRPEVKIYERDRQDYDVAREGYSISIRSDTGGMQALQKMGLLDSLLAASITGIQGPEKSGDFALWDRDWNAILKGRQELPEGLPSPHMRIARNVLRRKLIESLGNGGSIEWDMTCTGAEQLGNGKIGLQLSSGKVEQCDLLIVADGSRSKIRESLRPQDNLIYAGAVAILGNATFPDGHVPSPMDRDWGLCLGGQGHGLFVSPIDEKSAVWSLSYLSPEQRKLLDSLTQMTRSETYSKKYASAGKGSKNLFGL